ncbi:cytochrome P450 [Streptomyces sp. TLI_146]|uniref:cytochrome P450 n=1 Tax=Streptomyces sp. TLI_146 TaxID=1938858 RepID=UPI0015D63FE3|nr:cytochrome P450 [Streptomyces sp. TLI_146]
MLRCDSPVRDATFRCAAEPISLHGQQIAAGAIVSLVIGSINRDEDHFPDADRLDVGRAPNDHLALGCEPRFRLGAALARLEGTVAIPLLLERLSPLRRARPSNELPWQPARVMRGLAALPVVRDSPRRPSRPEPSSTRNTPDRQPRARDRNRTTPRPPAHHPQPTGRPQRHRPVAGRCHGRRFALPEVARGLVAAEGEAIRLPGRLPYRVAMERLPTEAPLPAPDASRYGLVNQLTAEGEAPDAALTLAGRFQTHSREAVLVTKRIVQDTRGLDGHHRLDNPRGSTETTGAKVPSAPLDSAACIQKGGA